MKIKLLSGICVLFLSPLFSQNFNVAFRAQLKYPNEVLANICGYTDAAGNEYALVGAEKGLSIVDITNPDKPVQVKKIPGASSSWREIKVRGNYAYVTTEGGGGLQIVNLSSLPQASGIDSKLWTGNGALAGLNKIHALHIDKQFVYLYGGDAFNGGAKVIDVTDPWEPKYLGNYQHPGAGKSAYVHDGYVRNDTLYACHIYEGFYSIVDFTNKKSPKILATQITPTKFTHNSWLSNNSKTLFTTDENSGSFLTAYDLSDLNNIKELDRIQAIPGSKSVVHNTHIITVKEREYAVTSWYRDGFTIVDVSRPHNMVQVGRYDTYPSGAGDGFNGDWGVFPYFPSGNIVVSNIEDGLHVFTPTYIPATHLEGVVSDSLTGKAINGATIEIVNTTSKESSKLTGNYAMGISLSASGKYDIQYSKTGYLTHIFKDVTLKPGDVIIKNVKLYNGKTAVAENEIDATVNCYPNPFNNETIIDYQLQNKIGNRAEIVITDVVGRDIKKIKINETAGKITLHELTDSGIYFVSLVTENGSTKPLKIIKLK